MIISQKKEKKKKNKRKKTPMIREDNKAGNQTQKNSLHQISYLAPKMSFMNNGSQSLGNTIHSINPLFIIFVSL